MERESFIEYANIIISRTYKNYDELIEVVEKHIKKVPREIFNRTSIAYRDLKQYQKDKGEL
jgi:DNA-directed RNA polymerase delta subunit